MRATIASVLLGACLVAGCASPEQTPAPQASSSPASAPPPVTTPEPSPPVTAPAPAAATNPPLAAVREEPLPKVPDPLRLPPLPDLGFPPPRPIEEVRAVYRFAALHPEVMRYMPCFCGCERSGHQDNEDCFIKARAADGSVEYDPHGFSCAICIDVARDAMRMRNSGADVPSIRRAIELRYRTPSGTITPTPAPKTGAP
ncbi:MAG TPA: PCYCGC motif-containing (lipo)protein [Vicinamibacterales bacterium]|jgi:hypothetical protein